MKKISKIFILSLLLSCKEIDNHIGFWVKISENLQYQEQNGQISLKSGKFQYKFQKDKIPFRKIMVFNITLLGFVTELGQENKIIGIVGAQYVSSEKVKNLIRSGEIQ